MRGIVYEIFDWDFTAEEPNHWHEELCHEPFKFLGVTMHHNVAPSDLLGWVVTLHFNHAMWMRAPLLAVPTGDRMLGFAEPLALSRGDLWRVTVASTAPIERPVRLVLSLPKGWPPP